MKYVSEESVLAVKMSGLGLRSMGPPLYLNGAISYGFRKEWHSEPGSPSYMLNMSVDQDGKVLSAKFSAYDPDTFESVDLGVIEGTALEGADAKGICMEVARFVMDNGYRQPREKAVLRLVKEPGGVRYRAERADGSGMAGFIFGVSMEDAERAARETVDHRYIVTGVSREEWKPPESQLELEGKYRSLVGGLFEDGDTEPLADAFREDKDKGFVAVLRALADCGGEEPEKAIFRICDVHREAVGRGR